MPSYIAEQQKIVKQLEEDLLNAKCSVVQEITSRAWTPCSGTSRIYSGIADTWPKAEDYNIFSRWPSLRSTVIQVYQVSGEKKELWLVTNIGNLIQLN